MIINNNKIQPIVSRRLANNIVSASTRNNNNLVNVHCLSMGKNFINKLPLSLCLLNAHLIRNKSADFVEYACESKVDIFAITETWLG